MDKEYKCPEALAGLKKIIGRMDYWHDGSLEEALELIDFISEKTKEMEKE